MVPEEVLAGGPVEWVVPVGGEVLAVLRVVPEGEGLVVPWADRAGEVPAVGWVVPAGTDRLRRPVLPDGQFTAEAGIPVDITGLPVPAAAAVPLP